MHLAGPREASRQKDFASQAACGLCGHKRLTSEGQMHGSQSSWTRARGGTLCPLKQGCFRWPQELFGFLWNWGTQRGSPLLLFSWVSKSAPNSTPRPRHNRLLPPQVKPLLFFFGYTVSCGSSPAGNQTYATVATWAAAVTLPDPYPTALQEDGKLNSLCLLFPSYC